MDIPHDVDPWSREPLSSDEEAARDAIWGPAAHMRAPRVQRVDRCANVTCPNRAGEGQFTVVTTASPIVGGHHPITLIMCCPCAVALTGETS